MTKPSNAQLAALGAALDAFARRYKIAENLSGELPLNEVDKQVLLLVAEHPDCGPTDAARLLNVAATTLTSAADRLEKKGLLERVRLASDRRAVALRLSEAGRARVDAFLDMHRTMYRNLLAPLSSDERNEFIRLMTKVAQNED